MKKLLICLFGTIFTDIMANVTVNAMAMPHRRYLPFLTELIMEPPTWFKTGLHGSVMQHPDH